MIETFDVDEPKSTTQKLIVKLLQELLDVTSNFANENYNNSRGELLTILSAVSVNYFYNMLFHCLKSLSSKEMQRVYLERTKELIAIHMNNVEKKIEEGFDER